MSIAENAVKLNKLEQEIFRLVCGWGCELFKQALERFDDTLMLERDRTIYRHKGPRQTAIKTVMGIKLNRFCQTCVQCDKIETGSPEIYFF